MSGRIGGRVSQEKAGRISIFRTTGGKGTAMEKIKLGYHWECKYCDYTRGVPYPDEPDFLVCGRCGAEWEGCKILVDDGED